MNKPDSFREKPTKEKADMSSWGEESSSPLASFAAPERKQVDEGVFRRALAGRLGRSVEAVNRFRSGLLRK